MSQLAAAGIIQSTRTVIGTLDAEPAIAIERAYTRSFFNRWPKPSADSCSTARHPSIWKSRFIDRTLNDKRGITMKRQFVLAMTIAVAVLGADCDRGGGERPTATSPGNPHASVALSEEARQAAAAHSTPCGFGTDSATVTVGTPPPDAPPPVSVQGQGGTPLTVQGPSGTAPSGPPPAGAELAIGGAVENLGGSCPTLTFVIHGMTVRTNETTSFADGACSSLKNGGPVGARGMAQADGSVAATCVVPIVSSVRTELPIGGVRKGS